MESVTLLDSQLYTEVCEGLSRPLKFLPSKLFYDKRGSELFEAICHTDEYYLTRTEIRIMENYIDEISTVIGEHVQLIELGSGSSRKTRILLDNLKNIYSYVPVDISESFLGRVSERLRAEYPGLKITPVAADYTRYFLLPGARPGARKIVYFPGSTIGNFTIEEAEGFIELTAQIAGDGGGLLIGFDLKKDASILENAYNDHEGLTATFNKNILVRINRELGANFNPALFKHKAFFNSWKSRIEMRLVSLVDQQVHIYDTPFYFAKGESIHTENSYKYTLEAFRKITSPFFKPLQVWTDYRQNFCVQFLTR